MSALDVLRQLKLARRAKGPKKIIEWGNADYINEIGAENLSARDLRNHLEARDLDTVGTRLELIERLRVSLADEQLHKFAYKETLDTEFLIQADLEERGSVYVAGRNDKGQLGIGDTESRQFFCVIPQMRGANVYDNAVGDDLTYAFTEDHIIYVWGGAGVGRTGYNPNAPKSMQGGQDNWLEPTIVYDLQGEDITQVSVGASHCVASAKGGDCFVWGDGGVGQLGLGHFEDHPTIGINNSFSAIKQVEAGQNHTVALTETGRMYAWGHAANGRLGVGSSERIGVPENERQYFPVPTLITNMENIKSISCGADHTLAIGDSGVWAWGCNSGGKLGLGDQKDRYDPIMVPRLKHKIILQISAGTYHSMALVQYPPMKGGGAIYTWGSGYHGQLAQDKTQVSMLAQPVNYFFDLHILIKHISAGAFHCAAITREGELYTWGSNAHGNLARVIDERDVQYTPTPGHVGGFGAIVDRIGRGFPRSVRCGRDYTIVCTWPYEGPNFDVCSKLMEEKKIREEEALLQDMQAGGQGALQDDDD